MQEEVEVASLLLKRREGQSALSRGMAKFCLRLSIFQCLAKVTAAMKNHTKFKVHAVLRFLMATHYLAAAIHKKLSLSIWYRPKVVSKIFYTFEFVD